MTFHQCHLPPDQWGVMKEELTTLNVLQSLSCIITHLKIDRSRLKKEIRCHASMVPGGALRPLSDCAVDCGFDWNCISEGLGFNRTEMKPIKLVWVLVSLRQTQLRRLERLQLLTSAYWGCLCLPKGANKEPKPKEAHWGGGITNSHSDQLFAKRYRGTKKIDPNLPHC